MSFIVDLTINDIHVAGRAGLRPLVDGVDEAAQLELD